MNKIKIIALALVCSLVLCSCDITKNNEIENKDAKAYEELFGDKENLYGFNGGKKINNICPGISVYHNEYLTYDDLIEKDMPFVYSQSYEKKDNGDGTYEVIENLVPWYTDNSYSQNLPVFNFKFEDCDKINYVFTYFLHKVNEVEAELLKPYEDLPLLNEIRIRPSLFINNNVMSYYLNMDVALRYEIKAFNVDLQTKKIMSFDDILKYKGITRENFKKSLKEFLEKEIITDESYDDTLDSEELYNRIEGLLDEGQNAYDKDVDMTKPCDSYYFTGYRFEEARLVSYPKFAAFYLNENNELVVYFSFCSYVGDGYDFKQFIME